MHSSGNMALASSRVRVDMFSSLALVSSSWEYHAPLRLLAMSVNYLIQAVNFKHNACQALAKVSLMCWLLSYLYISYTVSYKEIHFHTYIFHLVFQHGSIGALILQSFGFLVNM